MSDLRSTSEPVPARPSQSQFTLRNLLVGMAVVALVCSAIPKLGPTWEELNYLFNLERKTSDLYDRMASSISDVFGNSTKKMSHSFGSTANSISSGERSF